MQTGTDWLSRLGVRIPLLQAPMAGVSTPALAAAVSDAGALGAVALGAGDAAQAALALDAVAALTSRPVQANVFCHRPPRRDAARDAAWLALLAPRFHALGVEPPATLREIYRSFVDDDAMLDLLVARRLPVVSFHFGVPPPAAVARLRAAGSVLLASVTSLQEAAIAREAGVDVLVAQGIEAGGHRGNFDPAAADAQHGTLDLVRGLVAAFDLPVVAAGGIMDGAGIAAARAAGACGAQLGTAFIACPESAADAAYRARLVGGEPTRFTKNVSGRAARGFANALSALSAAPPDYPLAYDAAKALHAAALRQGSREYAVQWAGSGAARARALPAADLVERLAAEMS